MNRIGNAGDAPFVLPRITEEDRIFRGNPAAFEESFAFGDDGPREQLSRTWPDVTILADFSANLMRDLAVNQGQRLTISLPPDSLRVFARS